MRGKIGGFIDPRVCLHRIREFIQIWGFIQPVSKFREFMTGYTLFLDPYRLLHLHTLSLYNSYTCILSRSTLTLQSEQVYL